jgi:hypothetical protein
LSVPLTNRFHKKIAIYIIKEICFNTFILRASIASVSGNAAKSRFCMMKNTSTTEVRDQQTEQLWRFTRCDARAVHLSVRVTVLAGVAGLCMITTIKAYKQQQ